MALTPSQLIQLNLRAGFKPQDAQTMAALMLAESSGNPVAHNKNASTGDNSYGLGQINMIGSLGPARLKQFGLSNYDQLLDPQTNARAAKTVKDSSGWNAWSTYGTPSFKSALGQVQKAAGLPATPSTVAPTNQQNQPGNVYNIYMSGGDQDAQDFLKSWIPKATERAPEFKSSFNPLAMLQAAFSGGSTEYG
jgi:hypothetical protein